MTPTSTAHTSPYIREQQRGPEPSRRAHMCHRVVSLPWALASSLRAQLLHRLLLPQVAVAPTERTIASQRTRPAQSVPGLCARSVRWSFILKTWRMASSARTTFIASRAPTRALRAGQNSKAAPQAIVHTASKNASSPITSAGTPAAVSPCVATAHPAIIQTTRAKGTGARHTRTA